MNKTVALHWAEAIDSWRVFPRLWLLSCFLWTFHVTNTLLNWYTVLPKDERSLEASGFASIVFLAVFGFLKLVYDTYARTSRDWNLQPPSATSTVISQTTTQGTPP